MLVGLEPVQSYLTVTRVMSEQKVTPGCGTTHCDQMILNNQANDRANKA
ncbi:hypothetical protein AVEN_57882-1, partial [Araneus ventricosus]